MPLAVVGTTVPKSANNRITAPQVYSCAHYHHFASAPTAAAANGTKLVRPSQRLEAHARRSSIHSSDDEWVTFDGEDEWNEQSNTSLRPSASSFIPQAIKALSLVTEKLTDIALQFAPEDASPGTVRTAVVGSMLLVALSFIKGILSFILTIGTIIFGAFVAVRVFGLEVGSGDDMDLQHSSRQGRGRNRRSRQSSRSSSSGDKRRPRLPLLQSPFAEQDEEEDASGLMDVWFEVTKTQNSGASDLEHGKKRGKRDRGDGKGNRTRQA